MKKVFALLIVVVLSLAVVTAIHAQEATDTPAPTVEATQEPTGNGNGGVSIFTPDLVKDIFGILTFLAIGFAAGRYRPGDVARELQKNKDALDSAERIALKTIPVDALELIRGIIKDVKDIADVADKITDGQNNPTTG